MRTRSMPRRALAVLFLWIVTTVGQSPDEFLSKGDELLLAGNYDKANEMYRQGIALVSDDDSLTTEISLHTNLATSLSSGGNDEKATESYQQALLVYKDKIGDIVEPTVKEEIKAVAAQAAFFLGLVYQDLGHPRDAADAYAYANELDPMHWAACANLGAIFHDELADYSRALEAYHKAYEILTNPDEEPTDPPPEPRFILSQLQYRIGLCISHDATRKCVLDSDPDTPMDCNELAANAFSTAVKYDPDNESAKHMLATVTADATMKRASNTYVKSLFDDYAENFEHSLVEELGYTGYERLRRGFDRAFNGKPPTFRKVVDAGCGTGLAGEQFRNISKTLIGVDLSEAIIQEAVQKRPGLYDETIAGDVINVFQDKKPIPLIIAADSFIYFGDLTPLFEAMGDGVEEGGYAAFTLENVSTESEESLATTKPDWRWQLTASGRFAHRRDYVEQMATSHGFSVVRYEELDGFRYERGVPVRGHIFVLQKGRQDKEL